jgi:short subunit dehydrogenase-like uncharacterized protein
MQSFLLYGANGYTGKIITALASQYDLKPILAGRKEVPIRTLAKQFNFSYLIFDLNNQKALLKALENVPLVLHAAGPFRHTAKQMMDACLKTKTHYLDITGEIAVFEMAKKYDELARKAGIMIMPGVGFDVVPTDCLALYLKNKLPDAAKLKIAFATLGGGLSHGTASTMMEGLGEGGAVREKGKIIRKPLGHKGMLIDFGVKKIFVMTIPWGDISTAYYSTGIPNIETYTGIPRRTYKLLKFQALFNWVMRSSLFRKLVRRQIEKRPAGPSDEERKKSKSLVWGEVQNEKGERVTARLTTLDGYTFTAHSGLIIAKKVMNGNFKTGYQTPASAYGPDLVLEVPGSERVSE